MAKKINALPQGLFYQFPFINRQERGDLLTWLATLHPIWEMRFSENNPPPPGDTQRQLLRPVYWLGNWQFACLNYYHPPEGIEFRCVQAETYPPLLRKIVERIEFIAHKNFPKNFIPEKWRLNTCLVNFYGSTLVDGKKTDTARVGEHKDFEPGPVGSLSLGERAFFQFVNGKSDLGKKNEIASLWLEDSSLQLFAGPLWKQHTFHRVQRVENKKNEVFDLRVTNFETRRINFTFRYVPEEHILPWEKFPNGKKSDTLPYIKELAEHSTFFKQILNKATL